MPVCFVPHVAVPKLDYLAHPCVSVMDGARMNECRYKLHLYYTVKNAFNFLNSALDSNVLKLLLWNKECECFCYIMRAQNITHNPLLIALCLRPV